MDVSPFPRVFLFQVPCFVFGGVHHVQVLFCYKGFEFDECSVFSVQWREMNSIWQSWRQMIGYDFETEIHYVDVNVNNELGQMMLHICIYIYTYLENPFMNLGCWDVTYNLVTLRFQLHQAAKSYARKVWQPSTRSRSWGCCHPEKNRDDVICFN